MFEFETIRYEHDFYQWGWNKNGNLVGLEPNGKMKFTWQPHGSQFTIVEAVPANRIAFRLRLPEPLPFEVAMKAMGFDDTWIEIL